MQAQTTDIQVSDFLTNELKDLLKNRGETVNTHLDSISETATISSTRTRVSFYRVGHELTTGRPDLQKLAAKLNALLLDFVCTRKQLREAISDYEKTKSAQAVSVLQAKAKSLFVSQDTSGEPGELLLYYLVERILEYPQLFCKFNLKTNSEVHVHGADGIHASVDSEKQCLRLHWGEAKLYQSISSALDDAFTALKELIYDIPGGDKSKKRDIELLRDYIELDNPDLEVALLNYLDPDHEASRKVQYCGIVLVGFDLQKYDNLTKALDSGDITHITQLVNRWSTLIRKRLSENNLVSIQIDTFLLPFQSVQDFRTTFLRQLGVAQ